MTDFYAVGISMAARACAGLLGVTHMRFSETRADAFARYALPGMLNEQIAENPAQFILWMKRNELASILGMTNSRLEHIEYVSKQAAREGIITAVASGWVYFMYEQDTEVFGKDVDQADATAITDAFTKVHGSEAAQEMWDRWTDEDEPVRPVQVRKAPKRVLVRKKAASGDTSSIRVR